MGTNGTNGGGTGMTGEPPAGTPPTGTRLVGGIGLTLLGLGLAGFGLWTGYRVIGQFHDRPPPPRDVPLFVGVFLLVFFAAAQVAAGAALLAGGVRLAREALRRAAFPDQPWMWRHDWAAGLITHSFGRPVPAAWLAALAWNAVVWGALMPLVPVRAWVEQRAYPGLGCAAFLVAVGVALFAMALVLTRRWWRYRASVLEMTSVPGQIGGRLGGTIRARVTLPAEELFRVRLVCEQSPGLGGSRDALWQPEYTVGGDALAVSALYSAIPVRFEIPAMCRPTAPKLRNAIVWRLEVTSQASRVPYRAEFQVPVFAVPTGPEAEIAEANTL